MTQIFSDGAGFHYLGDCIYANHDINFSNTDHLQATPITELSASLQALCNASGLRNNLIIPQSAIPADGKTKPGQEANGTLPDGRRHFRRIIEFSSVNDTIDDRITFVYQTDGTTANPAHILSYKDPSNVYRYCNNGSNFFEPPNGSYINDFDYSPVQVTGISNGKFLALFAIQTRLTDGHVFSHFWYGGELDQVNTTFNYYSENIVTRSIFLFDYRQPTGDINLRFRPSTEKSNQFFGRHFIGNNNRLILRTGKAIYPISCSDGQTPQQIWLTDYYVFHANVDIGQPAMGKPYGLLYAQGDFTIGKPVKITGTVTPDYGSLWYLPVGTYGNRTILMKCYSSVNN